MKLDTGSVIKRDPSCTGFQPAPALCRASAGLYFHDGKHTLSGIFPGSCVIRACTLTDVQVIDADTDKERTVISRCSADCNIILGEIPSLDDAAQIADIGAGSHITAVLDDLHRFLIVSAALQTIVAECGIVLCTEQIRRMVGNGREWFVAPLEIIEETIQLIVDGKIENYRYDTVLQQLVMLQTDAEQ